VNLVTPTYTQRQVVRQRACRTSTGATATANSYINGLAVQQRMSSYVQIATSFAVLSPVAKEPPLAVRLQQLKSNVSASNPTTTVCSTSRPATPMPIRLQGSRTRSRTECRLHPDHRRVGKQPVPDYCDGVPACLCAVQPLVARRRLSTLIAAGLLGVAIGVGLALCATRSMQASSRPRSSRPDSRPSRSARCRRPRHPEASDRDFGPSPAGRRRSGDPDQPAVRADRRAAAFESWSTSAVAEEGKTMVACNSPLLSAQLAWMWCSSRDLRRPRIAEYMELSERSPHVGSHG